MAVGDYSAKDPVVGVHIGAKTPPNSAAVTVDPTGRVNMGGLQLAGRVFAILGDSISYNNNAGTVNMRAAGYMTHAIALSNGKIYFDSSYNFGVSGDTSVQALARISAVIAKNPDYCVVLVGTNDPFVGVSFEDTVASCTSIYTQLSLAGITPVIVPVLPRAKDGASGAITSTQRAQITRIAQWQAAFAASNRWCILADPTLNLADHSLGTGDPIGVLTGAMTAYTVDGLHPSQRGAFWIGKAISDAVSPYLPDIALPRHAGMAYDATNNPFGNLLANPFMSGSATASGTGASGQIATSWTAKRNIGSTGAIACSKGTKTLPNGQTYGQQILAMTAPAGAAVEEFNFYQTVTTNIAFGTDSLYAEMEFDISGITADSLVYVGLALYDGTTYYYDNQYQSSGYAPNYAHSGVRRSPIVKPPSSATFVQPILLIRIDGTVASAGVTVKPSRAWLSKVPN